MSKLDLPKRLKN